jgi:hypothetical protein
MGGVTAPSLLGAIAGRKILARFYPRSQCDPGAFAAFFADCDLVQNIFVLRMKTIP